MKNLALLILLAGVCWIGWRLYEQQAFLDAQRLEIARLSARLAETEGQLKERSESLAGAQAEVSGLRDAATAANAEAGLARSEREATSQHLERIARELTECQEARRAQPRREAPKPEQAKPKSGQPEAPPPGDG